MRLFLKDSERKPDPEPVQTNDLKAVLVGLTLWLVGFAAVLLWPELPEAKFQLALWTCLAGIALGIVGLVYVQRRQQRK